jgi:hypothetical protein
LALNVLTKGLIGIVFPIAIILLYLLLTRGLRGALTRLRFFRPLASLALFLAIAAPWHILAALANPGHGQPGDLAHIGGHWQVPLPTDGNVHGWAWFYFLNEQLYRYLNLRVPHDYDTAPLWLFLGLIAVWLMPWSAFLPSALAQLFPLQRTDFRTRLRARTLTPPERTTLFLILWAVIPLAFFTFSTRQEYYVLPSLPPLILLIAQFFVATNGTWVPHSSQSHRDEWDHHASSVVEAADAYLRDQAIAEYKRRNTSGGALSISSDAARELGILVFDNSMDGRAPLLATISDALRATGAYTASSATEAMLSELDKLRNNVTVTDDLYQQFRAPLETATGVRSDDSPGSRRIGGRASDARHAGQAGQDATWRTGARAVSFTLLIVGTLLGLTALYFFLTIHAPAPGTDLATLLSQNPADYALSFGHFLDLTTRALGLFPLCLILTFITLCGGPLTHFLLRRANKPHAATLALAAFTFLFLFAAHRALVIFAPTLSSKQLADAIAPQLHPQDLIAIHGEYEAASTLGFYLRRSDLHIVEGRSSNLWYGSFFPDAPHIFETRSSLIEKWLGPQRIFLWQDPSDRDRPPLQLPGPVYVIANSGGKQILSNQK